MCALSCFEREYKHKHTLAQFNRVVGTRCCVQMCVRECESVLLLCVRTAYCYVVSRSMLAACGVCVMRMVYVYALMLTLRSAI